MVILRKVEYFEIDRGLSVIGLIILLNILVIFEKYGGTGSFPELFISFMVSVIILTCIVMIMIGNAMDIVIKKNNQK